MSRAKKLCDEINAAVKEYGCTYLVYNKKGGLRTTTEIDYCDATILVTCSKLSEDELLDCIMMWWESESDSSAHDLIPNYLWAIRDRLWSDYNVD